MFKVILTLMVSLNFEFQVSARTMFLSLKFNFIVDQMSHKNCRVWFCRTIKMTNKYGYRYLHLIKSEHVQPRRVSAICWRSNKFNTSRLFALAAKISAAIARSGGTMQLRCCKRIRQAIISFGRLIGFS